MISLAQPIAEEDTRGDPLRQRRFLLLATLLFVVTALATLFLCRRMTNMDEMPVAGGWTMSMMWMRMPGQTWPGVAGAFMSMWSLMMIAMMMPVLAPSLARYRRQLSVLRRPQRDLSTTAVALGYFVVWAALGVVVFVVGITFAAAAMHFAAISRAVPILASIVVVIAGLSQLTAWKANQLRCCYHAIRQDGWTDLRQAFADGLRFGMRCVGCCAPLTAILVVFGMMNIGVMSIITIATALERTVRIGSRVAQLSGLLAIATGAWLLTQTMV